MLHRRSCWCHSRHHTHRPRSYTNNMPRHALPRAFFISATCRNPWKSAPQEAMRGTRGMLRGSYAVSSSYEGAPPPRPPHLAPRRPPRRCTAPQPLRTTVASAPPRVKSAMSIRHFTTGNPLNRPHANAWGSRFRSDSPQGTFLILTRRVARSNCTNWDPINFVYGAISA